MQYNTSSLGTLSRNQAHVGLHLLLSLSGNVCRLLDEELSFKSLEDLVDETNKSKYTVFMAMIVRVGLHDWCADDEHCLPLVPVQRQDREQALKERSV